MNASPMMRMTVFRKDKPPLSGVYDYLGALARLDFARGLPEFVDFTLEAA